MRGDKIVAVGNIADVSQAAGKNAERIDLHGKSLLPGLIDSHAHPIDGGVTLVSADVSDQGIESVDALVQFAAEARKSGKGMRNDLLCVSGLPLRFWSNAK